MQSSVAVLILFYNKVAQTKLCINSFLPSGVKIYVLNNGSSPEQLREITAAYKDLSNVVILDAGKNLGVSGGRNYLIKSLNEQWLFFVDNDIVVKEENNWLSAFKQVIKEEPSATIICPRIYNVHEAAYAAQLNVQLVDKRLSVETVNATISNCFPGGASIVNRKVFDQYGVYDEGMFVGFEDYEFAVRALLSKSGAFSARHIDTIELVHDHQYQKRKADKASVKQRYNNDLLQQSYERMVAKYDLQFDHDWQWWTENQLKKMTKKQWLTSLRSKLSSIIKN